MKNKDRLIIKFALILAIFVTLGCAASQALSTATPAVTLTPSNTPPPTATLSPTPAPDISTARIFLNELPAGFEELPTDELGIDKATGTDGLQPETTFAFVNARDFQMIVGMNFFLGGTLQRIGFDVAVNQPEKALKEMASAMGTQNVRDEKILDNLEDIGDARIAMTMVADMQGTPVQVDIVLFRRDIIGGMIISMNLEGQTPNISLHDLGKLFDQHIQETLEKIK